MGSYLTRIDAAPPAGRWPLVRGWIFSEPLPLFAELRAERPLLVLPELTLATRFSDCMEILRRHELFSVALYKPKQGAYWMDEDDTAVHWREKSLMRAILDMEEIPAIRSFIGSKAAGLLAAAGGNMDAVAGLTRAVPLALVQEWFGLTHVDPARLMQWSYWNQLDAFWNQPFDAPFWHAPAPDPQHIIHQRELAGIEMGAYLVTLVAIREGELKLGRKAHDSVTRLLQLSRSGAVKFPLERVLLNVGGLLIGAVETTSHAVVNVLDFLMRRPEDLARARAAARGDNTALLDGYVYEALRFNPAFPYFFRVCGQDAVLGCGKPWEAGIAKGTTVLAVTQSAMFDPEALPHPDTLDPTRGMGNQFHFGYGLHECLGRAIAQVMIPEIVRQVLRLDGLKSGAIERKGGPIPEAWPWSWHPG